MHGGNVCMKSLAIYIHIPFCVQKCVYCDFLSAPADISVINSYVEALKKEIELNANKYSKEYEITSIFLGGGTPSILDSKSVSDILDVIKKNYSFKDSVENTEITLEMNPGTATKEKLSELKKAGVNRLSIGLQSANDEELKLLGRIHNYNDFIKTYTLARKVGFNNINIDLMSALPGQNFDSWTDTLQKVINLDPEHISAYSLIIEENTQLFDNIDKYPQIPDESEDRRMYQFTKKRLEENGYFRYEISNYSKQNKECRHNLVYWTRDNYVGFGLGASSMVDNIRWKNIDNIKKYIDAINENNNLDLLIEYTDNLTKNDCMEEFMFLGLRCIQGISVNEFKEFFGVDIDTIYKNVIDKWTDEKMLEKVDDRIRLTEAGIDISNVIMADFLLD